MDDLLNYWAMAEAYLWPAKDRRVPWRDLVMRAKVIASDLDARGVERRPRVAEV